MPAFVSLRGISLEPVVEAFTSFLQGEGVSIGDKANVLTDRIQLFGAIGLSGKELSVNVQNCNGGAVTLGQTSGFPDLGQMLQTVDLGVCTTNQPMVAQVQVSALDSRQFNATIFPSPPTGFGVISGLSPSLWVLEFGSNGI